MTELLKLVQDNGITLVIAVGAIVGTVYLLKLLVAFVLKELRAKLQEIHAIIISLIDRIRQMDMYIHEIGGRVGIDKEEEK